MKKNTKILTIVLIILAILIVYFIGTSNHFITLEQEVDSQYSQIESTLQRRADLIPNLVATVKGYAKHEEEVFTEIAKARSNLSGSIQKGDLDEINQAYDSLNSAISRLLAISENYPTLQANGNFQSLQDELAGTENRINVARQQYNEKVKTYNTSIKRFPGNIVATLSGFESKEYFKASEGAKDTPTVNFE